MNPLVRRSSSALGAYAALLLATVLAPGSAGAQLATATTSRWASAIAAFEKADREHPPKPGAVLFLGSSSIRRWDLARWFPEHRVTNRGFGGSQISDSIEFFDQLVVPHKPSMIVFYAGDNDVAAGESAASVVADFHTFFGLVQKKLPGTPVLFISIKPSLARWKMVETMRAANREIAAWSEKEPLLTYIDVDAPMLGEDDKPRPELFVEDGLHMTDEGYRVWTELVTPLLP